MFNAFVKDKLREILAQLTIKNDILKEMKEVITTQNKEMREFKAMLQRRIDKDKV